MKKIKLKLAHINIKISKKMNKIIQIKADKVADLLTILAFLIVFCTTFTLNTYVAMYILALFLLIISYFITRR